MSELFLSLMTRVTLLSLVGLLLFGLTWRISAARRHALCVGALMAALLLPLLYLLLPKVHLPSSTPSVVVSLLPSESQVASRPVPTVMALPTASDSPNSEHPLPLLVVWATVASVLLFRLLFGFARLGWRVRKGRLEQIREGLVVITDPEAAVPMAAFWGRHLVLLPGTWKAWEQEQLEAVLSHEHAHISRLDWWTQLAARIACALYWPIPFVWILAHLSRQLAEEAADDSVLAEGVSPSRYAQYLLQIARETQMDPAFALPMARKAEVPRRIEMILNSKKRRGAPGAAGIVLTCGVLAALCVPLAAWAGQAPADATIAVAPKAASSSASTKVAMYTIHAEVIHIPGGAKALSRFFTPSQDGFSKAYFESDEKDVRELRELHVAVRSGLGEVLGYSSGVAAPGQDAVASVPTGEEVKGGPAGFKLKVNIKDAPKGPGLVSAAVQLSYREGPTIGMTTRDNPGQTNLILSPQTGDRQDRFLTIFTLERTLAEREPGLNQAVQASAKAANKGSVERGREQRTQYLIHGRVLMLEAGVKGFSPIFKDSENSQFLTYSQTDDTHVRQVENMLSVIKPRRVTKLVAPTIRALSGEPAEIDVDFHGSSYKFRLTISDAKDGAFSLSSTLDASATVGRTVKQTSMSFVASAKPGDPILLLGPSGQGGTERLLLTIGVERAPAGQRP